MSYRSLIALGMLATSAVWAEGDARLSESFDAPIGKIPEGWTVKMRGVGEAAIAEIPDQGGSGALLIRRTEEKPGNALAYFTGMLGQTAAANLKNFSGSVKFRYQQPLKAEGSDRGVVLRAQKMEYDRFSGYYLRVNPRGEQRSLAIYHNPLDHLQPGALLAETPLPSNLAISREYLLKFEAEEHNLRGELWAVDEAGNPKDAIAIVETQEAADTPGYFGIRGAYGNKKSSTWFYALHLELR